MFCAPSMHENGVYRYEIFGTREPALCDELELHINNICKKFGIGYLPLQQKENVYDNNNSSLLTAPLRQLINSLEIPEDLHYPIFIGQRHAR